MYVGYAEESISYIFIIDLRINFAFSIRIVIFE